MVSVMVRVDLNNTSGHTIPDCIRNDIDIIMRKGQNESKFENKIDYGWEIEQIIYNKRDLEDF